MSTTNPQLPPRRAKVQPASDAPNGEQGAATAGSAPATSNDGQRLPTTEPAVPAAADYGRLQNTEPRPGQPLSTVPANRNGADPADGENASVDLARIGWTITVLACLVAVLILVLEGYFGYAGVTFAVAVSAAINLR